MKKGQIVPVARSPMLQCHWSAIKVLATGVLRMDLATNECCDMAGAIRLALALSPVVWRIETYAGGVRDTVYELDREREQWRALV